VDKFKYLGAVFTSDGRKNKEIDTLSDKVNAVLSELHRSVVTKQELSNTTKLSVFRLVFVPILTCGHEFCVMTERVLYQQWKRDFAKSSRCGTSRQSAQLSNS